MTVYIVTGLGYGDEGKGTTVDFLCRQGDSAFPANLVVRHNGGSQAGHNVVLPDGTHHEFSQFGSGTLAGASTFLSRFMLVNPGDMMLEGEALEGKVQEPIGTVWKYMHVDAEAKVVTPYHVALNRILENHRNNQRHGSCGKGIGTTMQQHLDRPELTLYVGDLHNDALVQQKLDALRMYCYGTATTHMPTGRDGDWDVLLSGGVGVHPLIGMYRRWLQKVFVVHNGDEWLSNQIEWHTNVIFEGSQGILLDEWVGFHPYTTWSTTTPHNARLLLNSAGYMGEVDELGVIRAYMTRHGAGPFVTENGCTNLDEPHNHAGNWQGAFRQGAFDMVALRYAIQAHGRGDRLRLVLTHLDREEDWRLVNEYVTENLYGVRDLRLNPNRYDLEYQQRLTNTLFDAHAIYGHGSTVDTENLINQVAMHGEIAMQSWGPTFEDKIWNERKFEVKCEKRRPAHAQ